MDQNITNALVHNNLLLWTREGKHYAVIGHKDDKPGVEHHISDHEFEELKKLGARVEHAPHQVNR